jgi:hypothetical protein
LKKVAASLAMPSLSFCAGATCQAEQRIKL